MVLRIVILLSCIYYSCRADSGSPGFRWSCYKNPSLLADQSGSVTSIKTSNSFLLPQLNLASVFSSYRFRNTSFYIASEWYGYHHYRTSSSYAGAARSIGKIRLAIGIGVRSIQIPEVVTTRISVQGLVAGAFPITAKDQLALVIKEIGNSVSVAGMPGSITVNYKHEAGRNIDITLSAEKIYDRRSLRNEVQITFKSGSVLFDAAYRSGPSSFELGAYFKRKVLSVHIGASYNLTLGASPTAALVWERP
jgi:hypothetical protein